MQKVAICIVLSVGFLHYCIAQKKLSGTIELSSVDTVGLHTKIKTTLIRENFQPKDLPSDTIVTFPANVRNSSTFCVIRAIIDSDKVILCGFYSPKRKDFFGYEKQSSWRRIIKFKGSKLWPLMERLAAAIGGNAAYKE